MKVDVKVNYSAFKARLARMKRRGNNAREAFVLAMGATFIQNVVKIAPVDTRRYVRGWLQAAQGAGISTSGLPPIINSKKRDDLTAALSMQVMKSRNALASLEFRKDLWYEQTGRKKRGYYSKLQNMIEKQKERVRRAEEELEKFLKSTGGVVMMRGTGAVLNGYQRNIRGNALMATVRDKVYGGRGRLSKGNSRAGLFLHNLEPHCRVLEKRNRIVGRANRALQAGGVQKLRGVYVSTIATGARDAMRSRWVS